MTDSKSLSIFSEKTIFYFQNQVKSLHLSESMTPDMSVVDHTTMSPNPIGGESAGVYTFLFKNIGTLSNSITHDAGGKVYSVVHNGRGYVFTLGDDVSKFDLPINTQIRQRILNSIHFTD